MKKHVAILGLMLFCWSNAPLAQGREITDGPIVASRKKPRRSASKDRKQQRRRRTRKPPHLYFGLGLDLGWEAPYGNGISLHFTPSRFFGLNTGLGYNTTGVKLGGGAALIIPFNQSMGMDFTCNYTFSTGTDGVISLDAKFRPEDSSAPGPIIARKTYRLDASSLINIMVGGHYHLLRYLSLLGAIGYNLPIGGNTVTLDPAISFDKPVEATNTTEFDPQFDQEAQTILVAGGVSFSLGLRFLF